MTDEQTQQLSRADLASMTPSEIEQARRHGQLTELMGRAAPVSADTEITDRAQLRGMSRTEINQARREGRLDQLLGRTATTESEA